MLNQAHAWTSRNSGRFSKLQSNDLFRAPTCAFRSLIMLLQMRLIVNDTIPRMRKAHGSPRLSIIACVERDQMRPPHPLPAAATAFATDFLVVNHCGMMPTLPTNKKPMPQPKHTPWARMSWYFCAANDAPMRDSVSKKIPMWSVTFVPYVAVHLVANGATSMAMEIDSPPMKAYASALVFGK